MSMTRDELLAALGVARTREEVLTLQRGLLDLNLQKIRRQNFKSVQISLGQAKACSICAGLNGKVMPAKTPADKIIPDSCERARAQPTRLCSIDCSAAIKDETGSVRFDRA